MEIRFFWGGSGVGEVIFAYCCSVLLLLEMQNELMALTCLTLHLHYFCTHYTHDLRERDTKRHFKKKFWQHGVTPFSAVAIPYGLFSLSTILKIRSSVCLLQSVYLPFPVALYCLFSLPPSVCDPRALEANNEAL